MKSEEWKIVIHREVPVICGVEVIAPNLENGIQDPVTANPKFRAWNFTLDRENFGFRNWNLEFSE